MADPTEGPDTLFGDEDGNTISALGGADIVHGKDGNDTLNGGADGDSLFGEKDNDTLNGDAGLDSLYGGDGNDTLDGGDDGDSLYGEDGDDKLYGGDGADHINAYLGTDKAYGEDGDDTIRVGMYLNGQADPYINEIWDGGAGFDTLELDFGSNPTPTTLTIDLTKVKIKNFEKFKLSNYPFPESSYHYTFQMTTAQFNQFKEIPFPTTIGHIFKIMDRGAPVVLPQKTDFGGVLQLTKGGDVVDGQKLTQGSFKIFCGDGNDVVTGSNYPFGQYTLTVALEDGGDTFTGKKASESVTGGEGGDTLSGGANIDLLDGGKDDDSLDGGRGDDFLIGGKGKDSLLGSYGADHFVFKAAAESPVGRNRDTIDDFKRSDHDQIDLSAIDAIKSTKDVDDPFDFIGSKAFHGTAGELNFRHGMLSGDVDGDGEADFQIKVVVDGSLKEDDLIL